MPATQYASQEAVEGILQRKLTDFEALNIGMYLESASDYIERLTGRSWGAGNATKIYSGDGSDTLFIEPTTAITKVEYLGSDGSVVDTLDLTYITYAPFNKDIKTRIIRRGGRFICGTANYKVYGTTDTNVPSMVRHATALLVADRLNNPNNIKQEQIEGYSVTFDITDNTNDAIKDMLGPFIKPLL